jgi:2-polyprenyl-3-methyl-5-hydroxy-6-metoxy-1,4-benzoquinol methylase
MIATSYHDRVWEGVPEGCDPPDLELRRAYLLDRAATACTRDGQAPVVLDLGCGEGLFAAELQRAGFAVVAADVAAEPLRRARARYPALEVRLLPGEGPWPLPDAGFDVVWAGETIEHVADTAGWLSEVRRVMRPHGMLVLSTPDHGRLALLALLCSVRRFERHFDPRADHVRFYTRRTLTRLLADFGFHDIEVRGAGGFPGARRLLLASARRSRF